MLNVKRYPRESLRDEKGMVLVVALLLISALVLLGTTAVMTSTTDMKISTNYKTGNQAFYAAEAGIEETRARLKADANALILITDSQPAITNWRVYTGVVAKAQGKGYISGQHGYYPALQSTLDYTVMIEHSTNATGVLYWGDDDGDGIPTRNNTTGKNIYRVTSYGAAAGASKTIEVEMTRAPPISVPGALYVENTLQVAGSSEIIANLSSTECGPPMPGVATTMPYNTADPPVAYNLSQPDKILGVNGAGELGIRYGTPDMDISATADNIKDSANYTYTVSGNPTIAGAAWGTPTTGAPSTCSESNVIYYNSTDGLGINLHNSSGCGTLIVNGPLRVDGNFSWYGLIITTGSLTYIGTGNKNVTGAILSGGGVITDSIGGNAKIIYCSSAVSNATQNMPLKKLSWRDKAF